MYKTDFRMDHVIMGCLHMDLVPNIEDATSPGAEQAAKIKDKINAAWLNGDEEKFIRGNRSVGLDVEFDDDFITFLDENPMAFDMIRFYFYDEAKRDDPAITMSWEEIEKTLDIPASGAKA